MMRRISLLLAVMLLAALLLTGCGGKEPEKGSIEPVATEAPVQESAAPEAEPAAESPAAENAEVSEENEQHLSLGQFSGSTYTNSYAGFGCTLDDSWTFADAQQLQDITDISKDVIKEADLENYFDTEGMTTITDMYAENGELLSTINVVYSKLSLSERLTYMTMDEEGIIDLGLTQADHLKALYESMGTTVISLEKVAVNFLGEEHYAVKTVVDSGGITTYMLQFSDPFRGAYSITTTISCYGEDNTQAVADLFFPVEE